MPGVCRKNDTCTGHGCFPSRANTSWSPNVYANTLNVHRETDGWEVHCCGTPCHSGSLATGSSNVYVNGLPISDIGDPIDCGSSVATGSDNVFANGG